MQKDCEDILLRLKLSRYVAQWLGISEWTCGDMGTENLQKHSELRWDGGSYKYIDRFFITAVKMEEFISMVIPFYFTRKSTEVVL